MLTHFTHSEVPYGRKRYFSRSRILLRTVSHGPILLAPLVIVKLTWSFLLIRMAHLSSGALTNLGEGGWRNIFWMQAGFHGVSAVGLFLFYWPPKNKEYVHMKLKDYFWAIDPIGSLLFMGSTALMLLALNWAGGAYSWNDPHVAAPLAIGLALLVGFGVYGKSTPPVSICFVV